jgi:hypothetical protein
MLLFLYKKLVKFENIWYKKCTLIFFEGKNVRLFMDTVIVERSITKQRATTNRRAHSWAPATAPPLVWWYHCGRHIPHRRRCASYAGVHMLDRHERIFVCLGCSPHTPCGTRAYIWRLSLICLIKCRAGSHQGKKKDVRQHHFNAWTTTTKNYPTDHLSKESIENAQLGIKEVGGARFIPGANGKELLYRCQILLG